MCLLSALWLVDHSAAVSLCYVLTRDRMTIFCFSVSSCCCSSCCLRVAERRGVACGDVERSRRAISDARHESVAQQVQWHDEQSAH